MSSLIASEDLLRSLAIALRILLFLLDLALLGRRLLHLPFIIVDLLARLLATLAARRGPLLRCGFGWSYFGWSYFGWAVCAGVRRLETGTERAVLRLEFVLRHTHELAGAVCAGQARDVFEFLVVDLRDYVQFLGWKRYGNEDMLGGRGSGYLWFGLEALPGLCAALAWWL